MRRQHYKSVYTVAGLGLTIGTLMPIAAQAQANIEYNNFSDLSNLSLNGSPAVINSGGSGVTGVQGGQDVLRLTDGLNQSGSAYVTDPVTLDSNTSFTSAFSFQLSNSRGIGDLDGPGADGFVFAVQSDSASTGNSGFAEVNHGLGVEFDTFENPGDSSGNHIGIDLNGSRDSLSTIPVADRLNNGDVQFAFVDYNGQTGQLEVRLSDTDARPDDPILTRNVDLPDVLDSNQAFVGFTGLTGAGANDQDIRSFQFNTDSNSNDQEQVTAIPTPAALPAGLLLLSGTLLRRRRSRHA